MSVAVLTLTGGATKDILSGSLVLPLAGVGSARLEIDADTDVSGAVTISLARDDGKPPQIFKGTIVHGATFQGRAKLLVQLGAAKLAGETAAQLPPRNYVATPHPVRASDIASDIAAAAGETLATGVTATLGALQLPRWLRVAGTGAAALDALTDRLGLAWRVLPDGTVWIGSETWPTAPDVAGLYQQGDDGQPLVLEVAHEAASIVPGSVVLGKRIVEVVYSIGQSVRAELYYGECLTALFDRAVSAALPSTIYREAHGATVRTQHSDDTVDLEVDDARIGTITDVDLRVGIPTARVLVDEGTRVRMSFENGDPSKPFAFGIDAHAASSQGVARVGDTINCGSLTYAGPGALAWTHPDPTHIPLTFPITASPTPIVGLVATGSSKVLL